ncbi:helix-turn-helix transcriptional regulator [Streptococcus mutans]|uniref:helix-turn-helix transcriptional regulator n=1 Tax=Streptococcus mutans TaxID=1309 RepID=UPI001CFCCEB5|nr:helix-turn-helix domain-containing protein [Streptococcus mutans]MCB4934270.1 helix-turn-helix transcriptional regulator [Streptococcus mutans]MCB4975113.1 helix-turn-helix transcriptional regulator [Streptococcus mutans]MCB4989525.1 helix-turn-helix transcriptional regulator [Streptococcus mutans]MCB4998960.1 helix-turn-helix transcriptional regulator [Streptococcus mutans]MCB5012631.1 helix-turn-helix transcriptional regulator [Streptococcus mutans]
MPILKNQLKELRARDGINQTQLAKLAGISRQTVSLIERNEYTPSVVIAFKIAKSFGESVENVFSLIEEENEKVKRSCSKKS